MAIIGILFSIGAWSLRGDSAKTYANDVQSLVQQARFESVKRNVPISVQWEVADRRFTALLGNEGDPCAGTEIIVGRSADEYRGLNVTFDEDEAPVLVWLPSGQARSCDLSPFPGTLARIVPESDGSARIVRVSITGRVTVEQ